MNQRTLADVILCLNFTPSFLWYVRRISTGGEGALCALLIPVVILYGFQVKAVRPTQFRATYTGLALYLLAWGVGCPPIIKAALAITILLHHYGLSRHLGLCVLSYLVLPWLDSLQFYLGYPLRRIVAEMCALGLQPLGLEVMVSGTGLHFQEQLVFVDPPCSGVRMLWAGTIFTAALITLFRLHWVQSLLLYGVALLLLVTGNIIRGMILFFPEAHLVQWHAWTHQGLGILIYSFCLFTLVSLCRLLTPSHTHAQPSVT